MADIKADPGQGATAPNKAGGYQKTSGGNAPEVPRMGEPGPGQPPKTEAAKQKASEAADKAEQGLHRAEEKLRQMEARTSGAFERANERIRETEGRVHHTIDEASARTGERLEKGAARLDELARRADDYASRRLDPQGGMKSRTGSAVHEAADVMGSFSRYMRDRDSTALKQDLEEQARRNPLGAVVAGVGLGFLLGRLLR